LSRARTISDPRVPEAPTTVTILAVISYVSSPIVGGSGDTIYAMTSSIMSRSSTVAVDPLSDVLSLIKPRRSISGGIDAGGDWSFQFERSNCF
jgi:hypothetical protein